MGVGRMKTIKIAINLVLSIIISTLFVSAGDDAPPALPTEFWGDLTQNGAAVPDGLEVTAEVDGVNCAQSSFTSNGMYDVMLVNGDRELTYFDDQDCSTHWAASEACVPCSGEADCIEGPKDDDFIKIFLDGVGVMPFVGWLTGSNEEVEAVTPIGDWTKNGCVDMGDFIGPFADNYGLFCSMAHPIPACMMYDLTANGVIDMGDFIGPFADHYGEGC